MATNISDLIAQKEALDRQIREVQAAEKSAAISRVRELMTEYGLTSADIVAAPKPRGHANAGTKVAPKYRDPASGATWTGRGLKPKWLTAALADGKSISDFTI